jgi:N-dimethylarginine dimethylaminohydrolase
MDPGHGVVDRDRALAQWQALRDLLAQWSPIVELEPVPGFPDMVFTANAGLVLGRKAVVSRFYHEERKGESPYFQHFFESRHFEIHPLPDAIYFEGAGDALFDRGAPRLWAGSGWRTDRSGHGWLARTLGCEVVGLELVDPRFYHLDTCFCPLSDGSLLYYPAAFSENSQSLIAERIPATRRVAVETQDALAFSCNAVNIDRAVVLHAASPALREALEHRGFSVQVSPLDEFLKAGGSAKCLTLKLEEELASPGG